MWIRQSVCLSVLLSLFQYSIPRRLSANFFKCVIASEIILLLGMCKAEFEKKEKKESGSELSEMLLAFLRSLFWA